MNPGVQMDNKVGGGSALGGVPKGDRVILLRTIADRIMLGKLLGRLSEGATLHENEKDRALIDFFCYYNNIPIEKSLYFYETMSTAPDFKMYLEKNLEELDTFLLEDSQSYGTC